MDITGKRFGRLVGIKPTEVRKSGHKHWLFQCDCGRQTNADLYSVTSGKTQSCGCYRKEVSAKRAATLNGHYWEPLHAVWNTMKQRCHNIKNADYKYYGARGVSVCEEWRNDYLTFREWALSHGYKKGLTIDRVNTYGNYEPANCRFITIQEQQKNRRPPIKRGKKANGHI